MPTLNKVTRILAMGTGLVLAVLIISGVDPYDRATWVLEVGPAVIALPILWLTRKRFPLTPLLYGLVFLHALVLIYGGAYTYARVPLGFEIQAWFDLSRNPYDKIGHFFQGLVPALLAREILIRGCFARGPWMVGFLAICVAMTVSAVYELIEWGAAMVAGGGAVEFLGTTRIHAQGDSVPDVDTEALYDEESSEDVADLIEPPRGFPWVATLLGVVAITWITINWLQAIWWAHATHPALGWVIFAIGVGVGGAGLALIWRAWRQRHHIDAITHLNRRLAEAEREGEMGQSVVELREAAEHLLADNPQRRTFEENLLGIDAGSHATELVVALERGYAEQDARARALIHREVVRTGLFIAASPYPALDLLLVAL